MRQTGDRPPAEPCGSPQQLGGQQEAAAGPQGASEGGRQHAGKDGACARAAHKRRNVALGTHTRRMQSGSIYMYMYSDRFNDNMSRANFELSAAPYVSYDSRAAWPFVSVVQTRPRGGESEHCGLPGG